MSEKYEHVFSPIKIANLEIKNRVVMAPMEGTAMIDWLTGCKSKADKVHDFYIERAKDGVGLVIPGMMPVRNMAGNKWLYDHPKVFDSVKPLIEELHSYDTKVFMQIGTFSGRNFALPTMAKKMLDNKVLKTLMKPIMNVDLNNASADAGLPNVFIPEYKTRALTTEEVEQFVTAYAKTALLCKQAGADGVEIHAVHEGYLMDQFTLPYCNHRSDRYGGSFENRYRFAVEVVQAIKKLCGADYPVAMRYSVMSKTIDFNVGAVPGEEYKEAGRTMEESERAIKLLENAGVDMFDCDNGTYDAWYWPHPPVYMPLNCNLQDVEHIKNFTTKPVYCAGRMQMDVAEREIAAGGIDGVAIGRQFLCDEQYLTKLRSGDEADIRPCISCHNACFPIATFKDAGVEMDYKSYGDPRICALNSRTFQEKKFTPTPAKHPKHIAVVGGGIGGMEFAIEASKRGHTVDLYEKSGELGGVFVAAAAMSFKEKDKELLAWYKRQLEKSSVRVHMNHTVNSLTELGADEIVVATGATGSRKLKVPGSERCITAVEFLRGEKTVGETVAIVGGGLTGCEIAYELVLQGKKPMVIEMQNDLIRVVGVSAANSSMLKDLLRYHKVPVYLETSTSAITENGITIRAKDGTEQTLPADSVIASIGYTSGCPFEITDKKHTHVLGDAAKIGNLKSAIWAADDLVVKLSQ
ncbi:oxidoreductase [Gemmiger sp.]